MSQPVTIFDETGQPIQVRLTADTAQALGISDTPVTVKGVKVQGGMLLVDVSTGPTSMDRYLLAPNAFRFIKQSFTVSATPPPPAQG
jgi:hypothetical protein